MNTDTTNTEKANLIANACATLNAVRGKMHRGQQHARFRSTVKSLEAAGHTPAEILQALSESAFWCLDPAY